MAPIWGFSCWKSSINCKNCKNPDLQSWFLLILLHLHRSNRWICATPIAQLLNMGKWLSVPYQTRQAGIFCRAFSTSFQNSAKCSLPQTISAIPLEGQGFTKVWGIYSPNFIKRSTRTGQIRLSAAKLLGCQPQDQIHQTAKCSALQCWELWIGDILKKTWHIPHEKWLDVQINARHCVAARCCKQICLHFTA